MIFNGAILRFQNQQIFRENQAPEVARFYHAIDK